MYKERFEELKHSDRLPSPSGVGLRLLVLTENDDFEVEEVVDAIRTDPALTGRLIRLAGSAQGGSSVPVTSVHDAALRLGTKAVCHVALGFSLVSGSRSGRCRGFDYDRFWAFSLASAVAARLISEELRLADPAGAFTLGLLSSVGKLALASVYPEEYEDVQNMLAQDPTRDLVDLEREHLFIDHREVAAAMLEDWGLPAHYAETARHMGALESSSNFECKESEAYLKVLSAAVLMAEICTADADKQLALWSETSDICDSLGVDAERFSSIFDRVVPLWKEWGKVLQIPTSLVPAAAQIANKLAVANDGELPDSEENPRGLRVLAVDDDPVSLGLLVSLLKSGGHEVLTARDGREALAAYMEMGAQVIITDWKMPEMDGLMLCQQLRRTGEGRKLYILLLTGHAEEERIVEAFEAGVDDYIVKPFKVELLKARIQPAIRVIQLQEDYDRQVHEKERLNRQLDIEKRKFKAAAMTDSLTELPNRRYAMKRLEKEWANSQRTGSNFAVIMIDIDHFKSVNDRCGHDVGDVVLRSTARGIQRVLRRGDTCARMGGEEFLVVCPNTDSQDGVRIVSERIRKAIEETIVRSGEFEENVTISLGTALRSDEVNSIDDLLKIADEAVYEAKRQGRNRTVQGPPSASDRKSA